MTVGLLGALVGAGAGSGVASAASGPHPPVLEVTVIHATAGDGGQVVDPKLPELLPHVKEQPFTRFGAYRQLDRRPFPVDAPVAFVLPDGRTLRVTVSMAADGGEKRYQLDAQIVEASDAGKPAFLKSLQVTVSENEPFFIGGQSYLGGKLFLELTVRH
jgi:hypothetical protein